MVTAQYVILKLLELKVNAEYKHTNFNDYRKFSKKKIYYFIPFYVNDFDVSSFNVK